MSQVIIVGGGLAGLSAAHTVLERGGRVIVLDKNSFLGGNSTKATSGINGALTKAQISLKIPDSAQIFYEDTARSARDLIHPDLVKVLTYNSASAVEWLQEKFSLDLSLVSRLAGHSQPRTHRGQERFPGMTITFALMEKLEELAEHAPGRVRILKKAKVTRLLKEGETVTGVEYQLGDGTKGEEFGPVVLATGGYAADFTQDSLIKKHRPEIYDLPTTNGDWSTGDGIKMALAAGGNAVTLEKIQVHPTGLVDPKEPDSKVKFLAAEALRGVGGLLLDANGERFCDELGHRDYVTGLMWKHKGPFHLILNSAAGKEMEWHCKHYAGRGLMKHFESGTAVANEMGITAQKLGETFDKYNEIARTGKDPFGKKYFQNVPFQMEDEFWLAVVCPVLHFTMGGVEIDTEGKVRNPSGQVVDGLFAAGEVAGGVHGANRLGGSSLLGCVVYGRVAGGTSARYLLEKLASPKAITHHHHHAGVVKNLGADFNLSITVHQPAPETRVMLELSWGGTGGAYREYFSPGVVSATSTGRPAIHAAAKPKTALRDIPISEVAEHNTESDCWVVVNNDVVDATSFLPYHPGGKKSIMAFAGKDATAEFNMLHKPDVVAKYASSCVIGQLKH